MNLNLTKTQTAEHCLKVFQYEFYKALMEAYFWKTKSIENTFKVLCVSSIVLIYSDQFF